MDWSKGTKGNLCLRQGFWPQTQAGPVDFPLIEFQGWVTCPWTFQDYGLDIPQIMNKIAMLIGNLMINSGSLSLYVEIDSWSHGWSWFCSVQQESAIFTGKNIVITSKMFHENPWKSMEIHENPWKSMDFKNRPSVVHGFFSKAIMPLTKRPQGVEEGRPGWESAWRWRKSDLNGISMRS